MMSVSLQISNCTSINLKSSPFDIYQLKLYFYFHDFLVCFAMHLLFRLVRPHQRRCLHSNAAAVALTSASRAEHKNRH